MSLKFLYGTGDKNLQQAMDDQIQADLAQQSQDRFFLIVPNHIKFESEVHLMTELQKSQKADYFATSALQVFSFSRLAWYFLKDTQFYQKTRLDSAAISMILTKIFDVEREKLRIFSGELSQPGFLTGVAKQLDELQNQGVTPQILAQTAEQLPDGLDTKLKLNDLTLVYEAYLQAVGDQFITNDQLLAALSQKLQQSDLSHCHFYAHGFTQLTQMELQIMGVLLAQTDVTLTLIEDKPTQAANKTVDLFFRAKHLQSQLIQQAKAAHVSVHNQLVHAPRTSVSLGALGEYWQDANAQPTDISEDVHVFCGNDPYSEMETVALTIRRLVADQHYRYRDFLIVTKHLADYETVLKPIFKQFDLPYFNDLQMPMQDHPLLAFLTALINIDLHHFRYEDIMRLLKTELFLPKTAQGYLPTQAFRRVLDITDNYLLAHHLFEADWQRQDAWEKTPQSDDGSASQTEADTEKSQAIEMIHQLIRDELMPFYETIHQAKTAQEAASSLYRFMADIGVMDQLVAWQNTPQPLSETNQVADKSLQGFNVFVSLLDQYTAILGQAPFDPAQFLELLTAAFENTDYAQIPATLDAVNVSEVGMVQMNNRKVTFFMGLTSQNVPEIVAPATILNDEDRQQLSNADPIFQELDTSERVMANELYLAYSAFMSPTETLYLSYAQNSAEGDAFLPSSYLTRLSAHFQLDVVQVPANLPTTEDPAKLLPWIGAKKQMVHRLVPILRAAQDEHQPIGTPLTYVYQLLRQDESLGPWARKVFGSLQYRNVPKQLTGEVVDLLFGKTLKASVSQLETFYQNPYAYFLTYGLKLKERAVYDLSPASRGSFYHEVMDEFMKYVVTRGLDLSQIDGPKLDQILDQVLNQVYTMPQFDILNHTGRMHYIRYKLKDVLKTSLDVNLAQSRGMAFAPYRTEVPFGSGDDGLKPLRYELDAQHQVLIRGKIDRIDTANLGAQPYFNVIDYKSSAHTLAYPDVYYGLSLQMLTYLQSVLDNLEPLDLGDAAFAGAYYFHLQDPVLNLKTDLKFQDGPEIIRQKKQKKFRYSGLIANKPEVLANSDTALTNGQSAIVPIAYNQKTDTYRSSSSSIVTPTQLQTLLDYNALKIKQAAQEIFSGRLPLLPVRMGTQKTALDYSPFLAVFEFDAMLPENQYKDLKRDPNLHEKPPVTGNSILPYWLQQMTAILDGGNQ